MRFAPSPSALCGAIALSLSLAACNSADPAAQATGEPAAASTAQAPGGIQLSDAEVRLPAVSGRPGVAYFTVSSDRSRKIIAVTVAGAARAEMHETKSEGGAMTMAKLDNVTIDAGAPLTFAQGGNHVMLFDVDKSLTAGGTTDLTLTFDDGETTTIAARIVGPGGVVQSFDAGMADHDMADHDTSGGDMEGMAH